MNINKEKLLLSDVMCPICWNILIEPVTMPCKHELCKPCFTQNVQVANFECPMCRSRISTWARSATKKNRLINQQRWREIQEAFPEKVKLRLEGVEDDITPDEFPPSCEPVTEPGEIRKEYERQLKKYQEEEARERELEAAASAELIRQFELEEQQMVEKQKSEQILRDSILAQEIYLKYLQESELEEATRQSLAPQLQELTPLTQKPRIQGPRVSSLTPQLQEPTLLTQNLQGPRATPLKPQLQEPTSLSLKPQLQESTLQSQKPQIPGPRVASQNPQVELKGVDSMLKDFTIDLCDSRNETSMEIPRSDEVTYVASSSGLYQLPSQLVRSSAQCTSIRGKGNATMPRSPSAESHDSITPEMYHFKPITAAPKTPPKRQPDGRLMETVVVKTKARKLDYSPEHPLAQELAKFVDFIKKRNSGACGGSGGATTAGERPVENRFATHSSTYVAATSKPKNVYRKTVGIDSSSKENYPLYPEVVDSPIRAQGSKTAASTRIPCALAKRIQNRMDASDSLCSSAEETESNSIISEDDFQRSEQEKADLEFARRLQYELNRPAVEKTKIKSEYNLRSGGKKKK